MPGKNRYPLLGGHVPTELADWARGEAKRCGLTVTDLLTEALEALRASRSGATAATTRKPRTRAVTTAARPLGYSKQQQARGKR